MYVPLSSSITQLEVETSTTTITISIDSDSYQIRVGMDMYMTLTEEEIAAIYYAMNKLKTVRQYNNEPQEF